MPTEQEAKPAVVTPSLQQWRSPSTFRGAPGEDPLKWLKEFWEAFKNGLSGLFGDRQRYTRRAEEQLKKCRAQRSGGEYTVLHTKCIRTLPRVSAKSTETRPRPTYAAVTRKYRAPVQKFPPEPRKQICGERLTTDLFSLADVLGHVMRYCRERKAVFDNSRNRRRNFDDVGTEEEIRRPNSSRRFAPSPTRGRSPIRRYRSPSPYRRSSQSPGRRARKLNRATYPRRGVRPLVLEILRRPPR
ncbi:CCHC-type domain-containing protein [Trichonephila clavipes]|nr:CCHC-type domain-containing protein [Trichonephila clavipes]